MSTEERAYWMNHNGLWVDEEKFQGCDVIVIDDVSISGAHGASIVKLFQTIDVRSVTLVHVLKLSPELATFDPKIEDRMNRAIIRDLSDLGRLISGGRVGHPTHVRSSSSCRILRRRHSSF